MKNRPLLAAALAFAGLAAALPSPANASGVWTRLTRNAPAGINLMLLLSDGSVMCARNDGSTIGNGWYRLTPDASGSYINGTWSTLAPAHSTRLYYPSQVLRDGRVFVAGGEYGTGGPRAEVYDPSTNTWTSLTIPAALWNPASDNFYDCNSDLTPDGSVILMPVFPHTSGRAIRYNPATNTWSSGGSLVRGGYQDEATWVKLPDDTLLTLDPFGHNSYGNNPSERYNPATNSWINDSLCPVNMYDPFGFELGGGAVLPSGRALFIGSLPNSAIYTPSGSTAPGTWTAGPSLPGNRGCPDGPCAVMVNGKVLCALSPTPTSADHFPAPTTFWEFDEATNAFSQIGAPAGGSSENTPTYRLCMLCLPDGSVMYSHMASSVYIYRPDGAPLPLGKPAIHSVSRNPDGSYHLTGTGLNGISQGASYGDDYQMNTNYPLVRLESGPTVRYARTFNWSSTSLRTGDAVLSTEFTLPANLPPGSYNLVAVGNGFASDPVPFCTETPASISSHTPAAAACPGDRVDLTVAAAGSNLQYQWTRGGTPLANSATLSGVTTNTLTINPISAADFGADYACTVSNACGSTATPNITIAQQSCCPADFNGDGFLDFFDYDDYVACYETGVCPPGATADFNGDGFADFFDYDAFVAAFEAGC
jgi:hypothetical protein